MRKIPLLVGFLMLLSALAAVFLVGGPGLAVGAASGHGNRDGCLPVEHQYGGCEGPDRVAPTIVGSPGAVFPAGLFESVTFKTTGEPMPTLTESGGLPSGVSFTDNGDGTATLAGTAPAGSVGVYLPTITASNGVAPDAQLLFTLKVDPPPPSLVLDTKVAPLDYEKPGHVDPRVVTAIASWIGRVERGSS